MPNLASVFKNRSYKRFVSAFDFFDTLCIKTWLKLIMVSRKTRADDTRPTATLFIIKGGNISRLSFAKSIINSLHLLMFSFILFAMVQ